MYQALAAQNTQQDDKRTTQALLRGQESGGQKSTQGWQDICVQSSAFELTGLCDLSPATSRRSIASTNLHQ